MALHSSYDYLLIGYPTTVTFENQLEIDFPFLPPHLHEKIYAACTRITHLSGVAQQIHRTSLEMEALSEDGSSAEVFEACNSLSCLLMRMSSTTSDNVTNGADWNQLEEPYTSSSFLPINL